MKNNRIEVEETVLGQTNIQQHEGKDEKLNFKSYLKIKNQIIRNLQEVAETDEDKYVKKSEMLKMWRQEYDLSKQLLGNE